MTLRLPFTPSSIFFRTAQKWPNISRFRHFDPITMSPLFTFCKVDLWNKLWLQQRQVAINRSVLSNMTASATSTSETCPFCWLPPAPCNPTTKHHSCVSVLELPNPFRKPAVFLQEETTHNCRKFPSWKFRQRRCCTKNLRDMSHISARVLVGAQDNFLRHINWHQLNIKKEHQKEVTARHIFFMAASRSWAVCFFCKFQPMRQIINHPSLLRKIFRHIDHMHLSHQKTHTRNRHAGIHATWTQTKRYMNFSFSGSFPVKCLLPFLQCYINITSIVDPVHSRTHSTSCYLCRFASKIWHKGQCQHFRGRKMKRPPKRNPPTLPPSRIHQNPHPIDRLFQFKILKSPLVSRKLPYSQASLHVQCKRWSIVSSPAS